MSQTPSAPPPPPAAGAGTKPLGKCRSPLVVILLSIITLGIYALFYYYKTFQEMKDYSGEGIGGGLGLVLALFCGIVLAFLFPHEVGQQYEREGKPAPVSAATGLWILLPLIGGIILLFKAQGALNDFWKAHGATS
jgi:hypothetical protein